MERCFLVFVGGGVGAVARFGLGILLCRPAASWPYGTYAANLLGGLLMGLLAGVLALKGGADQERWRLLLGVGVLGGFTTFSSYSLETALMIQRKAFGEAAAYSLSSVILSILSLFAGLWLARRMFA